MIPPNTFAIVAQLASGDWLTDAVRGVLVVQAVLGLIGLFRLMVIINRFLDKEFPATMIGVNTRLDTLHRDLESLEKQMTQSQLDYARLSVRVDSLEKSRDRLDESWHGEERRTRRPPSRP